jgi:hypothetical protein
MKKHYFLIFFALFSLLASLSLDAQNNSYFSTSKEKIDGLTVYPNPVGTQNNYVYISTKQNSPKNITIFSVLGKRILSTKLFGKALNISKLNKGVYILNITENDISETRKLVIQ